MATGDWIILDNGQLAADRRKELRPGDKAHERYLNDPIARAAVKQFAMDLIFGDRTVERLDTVIVDLDGTLADCSDRQHFIKGDKKNWDGFHEAGCRAEPIQHIVVMVNALAMAGFKIVILTGRNGKYRVGTEAWLNRHVPKWNRLIMRVDDDFRSSVEVKGEILAQMVPQRVLAIFEDQPELVKLGRHMGYTVLQVADGAF